MCFTATKRSELLIKDKQIKEVTDQLCVTDEFFINCFLLLFSGRFDCVCGYFCAVESSHLEECLCLRSFLLMN